MPKYTYTYKTVYIYWIENQSIQKMPIEIEIPDWKECNHLSLSSRAYTNEERALMAESFREIFAVAPTFSSENEILHVDNPMFKEDKYGMWSYDDDVEKYRAVVSNTIQREVDKAERLLQKKKSLLESI